MHDITIQVRLISKSAMNYILIIYLSEMAKKEFDE